MTRINYTQLKIKSDYRDKLKKLADRDNRSMANMVEVLVDKRLAEIRAAEKAVNV